MMNRPATKLELVLCGILLAQTFHIVFLASRCHTWAQAYEKSIQNRIVTAVPASARTNYALPNHAYETNR